MNGHANLPHGTGRFFSCALSPTGISIEIMAILKGEQIGPAPVFYLTRLDTAFGSLGIIWRGTDRVKVVSILLPGEEPPWKTAERGKETDLRNAPKLIRDIAAQLAQTLEGEPAVFDLSNFNLKQCSCFQQKVLAAEFNIPRGFVSTYGNIAAFLGMRRAARAVGNALGANPFPIAIPCHRTIHADGTIGGYRGGITMKRKLLKMEGITFNTSGRVNMDRVYYQSRK